MKRLLCLSILLVILLAACSPTGTGYKCIEGVCIHIEVEGPVQAEEPALVIITVKTDKDMTDLSVGLSVEPSIIIEENGKIPEGAKLGYQDKRSLSWKIDTQGGQEYTFSRYVVYPKPIKSYGQSDYQVIAFVTHKTIQYTADSISIFLDADGNQVEGVEGRDFDETDHIAPTAPPDLTIVVETPFPSITPVPPTLTPTATPYQTETPTVPPYP